MEHSIAHPKGSGSLYMTSLFQDASGLVLLISSRGRFRFIAGASYDRGSTFPLTVFLNDGDP